MSKINVFILGSTGSIGTQTLDIIRANPDRFCVTGLTANNNASLLAEQINEFKPADAILVNEKARAGLKSNISHAQTKLHFGYDSITELVASSSYDVLMNALVGFSGFRPSVIALNRGKKVALANKESLVVGGELLQKYTKEGIKNLIPVDSEHSAILQCLIGEENNPIEKLIITASGGPFRNASAERLKSVQVEDALRHPNWSMGAKITIDSATMMNKGLEIIEAYWLYHLPLERIEPVIHPQSIIHSMVTFTDGSTKAQMGHPDMKVPIQYALTWPDRIYLDTPRMDFSQLRDLTFEPVNYDRFPCLRLALQSIEQGGYAPAILNAANEVAVYRFLDRNIPYLGIPEIVESALESVDSSETLSVESLLAIDERTRAFSASYTCRLG
ncbi:MAG: 1-deoxy-D-xylulose-5-phosphate reductoisomerase [Balneolales bacterium]|nr:1-deoxy-D-xylulose-5-phosphate reductoisomerase [Balneolales bacterium]